jgi:release factor glutamine methyltransferase
MPVVRPDPEPGLVERLRAAGCVFAEDEAGLLAEAAAGSADELERMVADRAAGMPLEVVVGWASFCGLRITVAPGVFVPRRRTEFLARSAAALAKSSSVVLDLCCGTGAVGAAVASLVPGAEVYAAELDPAAVACARCNLPPDRVFEGDLYDALPPALLGRVDVLVCNAPYVPTHAIDLMPPEARDHEPAVALDGGAHGLDVQARVADGAPGWLAPGGALLIETSERQASGTEALMVAAGLTATVSYDAEVGGTVVTGFRQPHDDPAGTTPAGPPGVVDQGWGR